MNQALLDMGHAYTIMRQAMCISGWSAYYDQVQLVSNDINQLCYYSNLDNDRDYPLCAVVRGILFDNVADLYQTLK